MRVPLWIEMNGLRVLVVGGGGVGSRRAAWFLKAGAEVRVLSLEFRDELVAEAARNPKLSLIKLDASDEKQVEEHVKWADIVVIATDNPVVNEIAWRLARRHRKLVNDATNADRTMIVVPYIGEVYNGGLKIAVTSEGLTGVAARHARDKIIECLESDTELRTLFEVMWRVKKVLKSLVAEAKKRIPVYFEVEDELMRHRDVLKRGDLEAAASIAAEVLAKVAGRSVGEIREALLSLRQR
ncbi:precorrin-2 dehydrogenase/sirohydrochlorin ferrochelatase family protein [Hyperthermus butylicus]|uniref:precorrin-2 dehydrogenase/sirohydrochlorin ferrochelatase family protein n=1 Tax=Hyperthermus butylicus TaxID=54248 RepID=UPI00064E1912|nr:NAD(P)-dependent oxidoreductase [Hyperthermus butylicus]